MQVQVYIMWSHSAIKNLRARLIRFPLGTIYITPKMGDARARGPCRAFIAIRMYNYVPRHCYMLCELRRLREPVWE